MPESVDVGIEGVSLLPLTPHPDTRGSFTEYYRREWIPQMREMVQGNLSLSKANVLRGLHFHREQADFWCFASGVSTTGLYDLRVGSPTEGKKAEIRVDASDRRYGLYIPKGVAHGFHAQTDVVLIYFVDQYFTGADEYGVAWNDPDLGIAWPATDPILSDRDQANQSLSEALKDAPVYEG
jgi:dTDP-4-dehydrorhamnose 3,5-epimerase